jgi:TPR repeat protein
MSTTLRAVILASLALVLSACATTRDIIGEKASRFDQAVVAYDAGDYPTAYAIWSELAKEDDLAAMRNAAQLLRQGKGVQKDSAHAFRLYKEAAEKGLVTAKANVADMYLAGEGVERNPQAAAAWYAQAATAGLSIAQMKLAEMYEQGIGVERDNKRALALLQRAARNGYAPAQAKLKQMGITPDAQTASVPQGANASLDDPWRGGGSVMTTIDRITGSEPAAKDNSAATPATVAPPAVVQMPAPPRATRRMMPSDPVPAAVSGRMPPGDTAQMNAGFTAYAARDQKLAFASWRVLAVKGNPEAQVRLGLLYLRGEGTGQDMIEAYRWLKLAADQGQPQAADEVAFVAAQLAPAERAIADSLVKVPTTDGIK